MQELAASLRSFLSVAKILPGGNDTGGVDAPAGAAAWARVMEAAAHELSTLSRSAGAWSESERATVVDAVDRTARVLEAAKAPVLVAQEDAGLWRRPGVRSFEAHRASKNREELGAARREAEAARTVTELDGGVEALARGELTPSHAQRLRAVADKVDPQLRAELLSGEGAARVRELAKQHDPKMFGRKVEELAASRRPAEVQDAHEAIRARRHLRILSGPDGTRIQGLLDPVAGYRFQLAIEAASPRPAEDDTRTLGQRNADALEAIAGAILAEGELSPSRHVPTQVMITMTEQSFLAAQAHLAAGTHTAASKGGPFPLIRAQDGPLLPPADLGKLLCGSAVGRLVVDAESAPLNVGRSQRTFKSHQRRAVELRDQHCAWPDCAQVARYCEVHHLDHWVEDHGETDVNRGVLVCSFHHHELHRHDLALEVVAGSATRPPTGRLPGDQDYEAPDYQLVPRSRNVGERRTRLLDRARSGGTKIRNPRASDRRTRGTDPPIGPAPRYDDGDRNREGAFQVGARQVGRRELGRQGVDASLSLFDT